MIIKNLKTFALAMLATGATVTAANAAKVTYIGTNVLQSVTATLTVYGEKTGVLPGSLKTTDILTAVKDTLTNSFSKKATLSVATTPAVSTVVATTNISGYTTNFTTNVANVATALVVSSNVVPITTVTVGLTNTTGFPVTTNVTLTTNTIGVLNGNYVTIAGSNVSVVIEGAGGPTTNTYALTNLTVNDNNTVAVGTNAAVGVDIGTSTLGIDAASVVVLTNGVPISTNAVGTNTFTVSTNGTGSTNTVTVTIGTTPTIYTNSASVTNSVELVTTTSTNFLVNTNGTTPDFGTNSSLTDSLATTITITTNLISNTNGGTGTNSTTNSVFTTNAVVLTTTTVYSATNSTNISSIGTNYVHVTNTVAGTAGFVVADQGINTPIPTNILWVSEVTTNDIAATAHSVTTGYDIEKMVLNATNLTLTMHGLVKSTSQVVTLVKGSTVTVTNQAWTFVSGYGTNNKTAPIVVGGTINIAAPVKQLVP